ncbi:helix-turn-helix domain-containing protein [Mycolicibacterium austroafricanum]|uniref:helix-turn-helix domain-containing protein n=1 Tax=Mycolicibacterium austroafricanum TaxID=39687 RepID=UPI001CA35C28|nr:helix-turn-helix transcriptional regulator [Mycolicibacterium austroafricanum]QZT56590.1 helix-turn-helix domain-containing protein [Mycolicibacterium austroafricanum]
MTTEGGPSDDQPVDDDFDKTVGANVRRYRMARGLSQAELADALSRHAGERIHQQTIQKIEKGSRPLKYSEAVQLSSVLQIQLYELRVGESEASVNAFLVACISELSKRNAEITELAQKLADDLLVLARALSLVTSDNANDTEGQKRTERMAAIAESFLHRNWGRTLNREIMTALSQHPFLADMREEFESSSYLEVLEKVLKHPVVIHPSWSQLPPRELLTRRPMRDDDTDA